MLKRILCREGCRNCASKDGIYCRALQEHIYSAQSRILCPFYKTRDEVFEDLKYCYERNKAYYKSFNDYLDMLESKYLDGYFKSFKTTR